MDSRFALRLKEELTRFGIEAWTYEDAIAAGEGIASKVEVALDRAEYVLVLLSRHALQSGWVRREIDVRLMMDLAAGRESIIPLLVDNVPVPPLLRSVKWIDFRSSFTEGIEQLKGRILSTSQNLAPFQEMFELIYLLLLLDQFNNGIWGASLELPGAFYGHGDDPGSISISTFSSFAITRFTGSRTALPIQAYRKYLLNRQSDSGAFGMKRQPGTSKYPRSEILEHARHTATGLSFFLFYDGYGHRCVTDALNYLLRNRTQQGLWVDFGPVEDRNVDPITVAFVIDAFEQVRDSIARKISKDKIEEDLLVELDKAIQIGLDYIFKCPLRTEDGFWFYKYSSAEDKERVLQNLYQYTMDVISSISISCQRLRQYLSEIDTIIQKLLSIAQRYRGLPRSAVSHIPHLDPTAHLISTAYYFTKWENEAKNLYNSLPIICHDEQVLTSAGANGWASVLLLYGTPAAPFSGRSDERISHINRTAQELRAGDPKTIGLPPELEKYSDLIRSILLRIQGKQPK
jgi:hypothetical protein